MSKKLTALLLALAMMLSLLAGCSNAEAPAAETEDETVSEETEESTETAEETVDTEVVEETETAEETEETEEFVLTEIPAEAYDDPVAYVTDGAIKKDDVVGSVDGVEIRADMFFNWLSNCYMNMAYNYYYYGMELDVSEVLDEATGSTVGDYFVNQAAMMCEMYTYLRTKVEAYGLGLTEDQLAEQESLSEEYTDDVLLYYTSTIESMKQAYADTQLTVTLRDYLYGEGGEYEPTEDTLADYAESMGTYTCRYILQNTSELAEDDTDGRAAKQQQAQELYDELSQLSGDELESRFIELQAEYNEDGNTEPFTFSDSDSLVGGFREKLAEMEEGEVGLTGETDYGYFVVLRLPNDLESLESSYIEEAYNSLITEWLDAAEIEQSDAIINLDVQGTFQRMIALQNAVSAKMSAEAEAEAAAETTETAE